jgi:hypothetical protein
MAMIFMDGFDHYGSGTIGAANMVDGPYADAPSAQPLVPPWGPARTGSLALRCSGFGACRRVLPAPISTTILGFGLATPSLPTGNFKNKVVSFCNASNEVVLTMAMESTGTLAFYDANGALLVTTAAPVIVPQNWHYVEMQVNSSSGAIRVDVDGLTVLNTTVAVAPPPNPDNSKTTAQFAFGDTQGVQSSDLWFDDLTCRDTTGAHNNGFEGDLRVATLFPNADGAAQGWTPEPLHKLGTGVLRNIPPAPTFEPGVVANASISTDIGAADFTLEGFFRFNLLPTGSFKAHLFGKWDELNNQRSYQLYLGGPTLESGNIVFRTSTNGLAGTVVEKISFPWPLGTPDLFTWYNICVCRTGGELFLFIDGIQYGLPIADSDTYFAANAVASIGVQVSFGSGFQPVSDTHFNGWVDEVRWTIGVGRYSANYAVTTVEYPRTVGGDPDFADVVLLCGFDSGINDESDYGRTLLAGQGAVQFTPSDGQAAYQTINSATPEDDTFIQAALLPAYQTITLSGLPANGETATVGHYTSAGSHPAVYTFNTVLGGAFSVLIGADIQDTLSNLMAAINHGAGIGALYGTGTIVNDDVYGAGLPSPQAIVTALAAGSAGNAITCTDTISGGGFDGATLDHGADVPGYSEFYFDRPPPTTTIIKAVEIVNRSYKSDAGAGNVQASFIGPLGGVLNGADNPLTISPTYRQDIFEVDPDTAASITPSTIVGGRVRIDRTV